MAEILPFIPSKGMARNFPCPPELIPPPKPTLAELVEQAIAELESMYAEVDKLHDRAIAAGISRYDQFITDVRVYQMRLMYGIAWLGNFRAVGYDRDEMYEPFVDWDGNLGVPELALPEQRR